MLQSSVSHDPSEIIVAFDQFIYLRLSNELFEK